MRFVSVRDLRAKGRQVWRELESEKELVVTSNGRPIALLTGVNEENFEQILRDLRRARALRAIIEEVMLNIMYELPSSKEVKKCIVTADTILNKKEPTLVTLSEVKRAS